MEQPNGRDVAPPPPSERAPVQGPGRDGAPRVPVRAGGRRPVLGQVVQGRRGVLPLRSQVEPRADKLQVGRHPSRPPPVQRQAGRAPRRQPQVERELPVRGVGRGAVVRVRAARGPHGRGVSTQGRAAHNWRGATVPGRRRDQTQLHVGEVVPCVRAALVHQRTRGAAPGGHGVLPAGGPHARTAVHVAGAAVHGPGPALPRRPHEAEVLGQAVAGAVAGRPRERRAEGGAGAGQRPRGALPSKGILHSVCGIRRGGVRPGDAVHRDVTSLRPIAPVEQSRGHGKKFFYLLCVESRLQRTK